MSTELINRKGKGKSNGIPFDKPAGLPVDQYASILHGGAAQSTLSRPTYKMLSNSTGKRILESLIHYVFITDDIFASAEIMEERSTSTFSF